MALWVSVSLWCSEGEGAVRHGDIDDLFHVADGGLGDHFASITGPLYFAYDDAKIEPRDAADVIQ